MRSDIRELEMLLEDIKRYNPEDRRDQAIAIINENKLKALMIVDAIKDMFVKEDDLMATHREGDLDTARGKIEDGFYFLRIAIEENGQ